MDVANHSFSELEAPLKLDMHASQGVENMSLGTCCLCHAKQQMERQPVKGLREMCGYSTEGCAVEHALLDLQRECHPCPLAPVFRPIAMQVGRCP